MTAGGVGGGGSSPPGAEWHREGPGDLSRLNTLVRKGFKMLILMLIHGDWSEKSVVWWQHLHFLPVSPASSGPGEVDDGAVQPLSAQDSSVRDRGGR